jgi:hypothetical protein
LCAQIHLDEFKKDRADLQRSDRRAKRLKVWLILLSKISERDQLNKLGLQLLIQRDLVVNPDF